MQLYCNFPLSLVWMSCFYLEFSKSILKGNTAKWLSKDIHFLFQDKKSSWRSACWVDMWRGAWIKARTQYEDTEKGEGDKNNRQKRQRMETEEGRSQEQKQIERGAKQSQEFSVWCPLDMLTENRSKYMHHYFSSVTILWNFPFTMENFVFFISWFGVDLSLCICRVVDTGLHSTLCLHILNCSARQI